MIVTRQDGRRFDTTKPIDISIPLRFNGPQPNAYGVEPASAKACEYGTLVGDTRRGGSCNFEQHTLIPHCSGTHTECVGHITHERISVRDCLRDALIPAVLVSVDAALPGETDESYVVSFGEGDGLITRETLRRALAGGPQALASPEATALIVRTLPNDDDKLTRRYGDLIPPYFTTEAMTFIVECGFKHLLVDMP